MKRIYFEFSEKAEAQLKRVVRLGNYETMADAIRIAIATEQGIQEGARQGCTQVILRNPNTGKELELTVKG
ncbi:MAG: hypothetical protein GDA44_15200 [Prochloron sp. SP5CPC1]|nr:hypothetical protein [Candidatus Paraprochloron terpiosi SP5CPC1]